MCIFSVPKFFFLRGTVGSGQSVSGTVLLVGGTGIDAKPLREVWKADAPLPFGLTGFFSCMRHVCTTFGTFALSARHRFRPVSWSQTTHEAAWPDAAYALWVPWAANSCGNNARMGPVQFSCASAPWAVQIVRDKLQICTFLHHGIHAARGPLAQCPQQANEHGHGSIGLRLGLAMPTSPTHLMQRASMPEVLWPGASSCRHRQVPTTDRALTRCDGR